MNICQLCKYHTNNPSWCSFHDRHTNRKSTCPDIFLSTKKVDNFNKVKKEKLDDTETDSTER